MSMSCHVMSALSCRSKHILFSVPCAEKQQSTFEHDTLFLVIVLLYSKRPSLYNIKNVCADNSTPDVHFNHNTAVSILTVYVRSGHGMYILYKLLHVGYWDIGGYMHYMCVCVYVYINIYIYIYIYI